MASDDRLGTAYLCVGEDRLKRDRAVERLKAHLDPATAAFNLTERQARECQDAAELVGCLQTLPFGGGRRVVIVHDADALDKPVSEALVSYLDAPNPDTVLCLTAAKLARSTRLYKAVARQGPSAVIDCAPPKRGALPDYVRRLAASLGVRLAPGAAEELVARAGDSTVLLDNRLRALAEQAGGEVGPDDVRSLVPRTADPTDWDVIDALCARDASRALGLYRAIAKPDHVRLLARLLGRLRELVCAESLDGRGEPGRLASELGRQGWQVRDHLRWARGFAPGELSKLLVEGAACDRALKGSEDSEDALVRYMLRFAAPARRGPGA